MTFVGLGRGCSLDTVEPGEYAFVTLHRNLYNDVEARTKS